MHKPSTIRSSKGQRVPNSVSPFIQHRPPTDGLIRDKIYLPNPPPVLPPVRRTSASKKHRHVSRGDHESTPPSDLLANHASYSAHINHHRKLPSLQQQDASNQATRSIQQQEKNDSTSRDDIRMHRRRVLKPLQNTDHHSNKSDSPSYQEHVLPSATTERITRNNSDFDSYSRLLNWTHETNDINISNTKHNLDGIRAVSRGKRVTPELKLSSRLVRNVFFSI